MTIIVDRGTEVAPKWKVKSRYSTNGIVGWTFAITRKYIKHPSDSVDIIYINNFEKFESNFSSRDLTRLASQISERSFAEFWDSEDDKYWESYL